MESFDLLLLGFKGIAIASIPIASIWIGRASKAGADRLKRLAWVTVFLTFDLIAFGGFTRLTDSGLGCPDWPGCYAKANPFMASADIHNAEVALPSGPVTMNKAWIEMIHRYLAMAVGLLIITMLIVSLVRMRRASRGGPRLAYPWMAGGLLGLVVLQGAFGAWTVTQRLQPIFVTTHLLLGLMLLAFLAWHALRLGGSPASITANRRPLSPRTHSLAIAALVVLTIQIALGGWVSANYAVLACTDFPTCQGVWLPTMDFANAFYPWRQLGKTADGGYLSVAALTAIHWTHRTFAVIVLIVLGGLAWRLRSVARMTKPVRALVIVLTLQLLTGLINVVFAWPLVAAVLHNAGAAGLVIALVVINYRLSAESRAQSVESLDSSPHRSSSLTSVQQSAG